MSKNWLSIAEGQIEIARSRGEDGAGVAGAVEAILMHLKEENKPPVKFVPLTAPDCGVHALVKQMQASGIKPDFCMACGANVPPITGEGTCSTCDPFGFLENPQLSDKVKLATLVAEVKKRGFIIMGARHNTPPVPPEMQVHQIGCMTSNDPYRNTTLGQPYESTRQPESVKAAAWPKDWPPYYHRNEPCDMLVGYCGCGTYHTEGEFTLEQDGLRAPYVARNIFHWPADHTGGGAYSSLCSCKTCGDLRSSAQRRTDYQRSKK